MAQVLRRLVLTIGFYSFLMWAYVVARVVLPHINPADEFIIGIPISFWTLGITTFVIGCACVFYYVISGTIYHRRQPSERAE